MRAFVNAVVWGLGVALGACIIWFVIWPWIASW